MLRAKEVMTREPLSLTVTHRLYHALDLMERFRVRHVLIREGDEWKGIVSDRDIKLGMSPRFSSLLETMEDRLSMARELGEVMTKDLVSVSAADSVQTVIDKMSMHKISSVIVNDGEKDVPVGIITQTDLLRTMKDMLRE